MNKKEAFIPFAFVALSLLFVVVCIMLYLSKGKSGYWLNRKMKIGALLLTLSFFQVNASGQEEICYMPIENEFSIIRNHKNVRIFNLKQSNIVSGYINQCTFYEFSFALYDENKKKAQKGNLTPFDGKFDSYDEKYQFELDMNLKPGKYLLQFFMKNVENQPTQFPKGEFNIIIKNE